MSSKKNKIKMIKRGGKNNVSAPSSIRDLKLELIKDTDTQSYKSLKTLFSKDLSIDRLASIMPIDAMQGDFTIQMEDESTKRAIEEWIKEKNIKNKIEKMMIDGFKFGDSGIFPLITQSGSTKGEEYNLNEELGNIKNIEDIHNYSRKEITGIKKEDDFFKKNYGFIKEITIGGIKSANIHYSRFFHFQFGSDRNDLYGESIINSLKEQINVLKQTVTSVGVNAFRGTIIQLATTKEGLKEMEVVAKQTGIRPNDQIAGINAMVTGLEDKMTVHAGAKFDSKNYYDTASVILCVAIGIPLSRWLGTQQGKLTGSETDIKVYNTRLLKYRRIVVEAFRFMVHIKLKEMKKEKVKFDIIASDLNILTEKELAEIEKLKSETLKNTMDTFNLIAGVNGKDIAREHIVDIASGIGLSDDILESLRIAVGES